MKREDELKINQEVNKPGATIQYCTGPDEGMMKSMVGRDKIKGETVIFLGIGLGIQKIYQIRNTIPSNTPDPKKRSSQTIIRDGFNDNFELYLCIPDPKGSSHPTMWNLTQEEFDLAREWELVDQGMQEDLKGLAITDDGKFKACIGHGLQKMPFDFDRIILRDTYKPFIEDPVKMLEEADKSRDIFAERTKSGK